MRVTVNVVPRHRHPTSWARIENATPQRGSHANAGWPTSCRWSRPGAPTAARVPVPMGRSTGLAARKTTPAATVDWLGR